MNDDNRGCPGKPAGVRLTGLIAPGHGVALSRGNEATPRAPLSARAAGVVGGLIIAAAGALAGSMNAGWFDLAREVNLLFPLLGLGVALVVAAWAATGWSVTLWRAGPAGRTAAILLAVAPAMYLLSWLIEFAIIGTLALGLGLASLAVTSWRRRLSDPVDRVLVTLAAVGSLTWNTETLSAFLLVGVGAILAVVSLRLRTQHRSSSPNLPARPGGSLPQRT